MAMLQDLIEQGRTLWNRSSAGQRAAFGGAAALVLATVAGVGYWASRPQYVRLMQGTPQEVSETIDRLEANNVPYQLSQSGSVVLVPKGKYNVGRAYTNPPSSDEDALAGFMNTDPAQQRSRLLRQRERDLALTIKRLASVSDAVVHIAQPDPSPFAVERREPTASVIVESVAQAPTTRKDAAAIVTIVARAVPGLSADNVSVVDSRGRTLLSDGIDSFDMSGHAEYRRAVEHDLERKVARVLEPHLGAGRLHVTVTADIDFTTEHVEEKTVDGDAKATLAEDTITKSTTGISPQARGAAGTANNVSSRGATAASGQTSVLEKESTLHADYVFPETITTRQIPGGVITRLSVAATVDRGGAGESDEAESDSAANGPALAEIEELIKSAVGFDEGRDDQIKLIEAKLELPAEQPLDFAAFETRRFYLDLLRNASLGVAAISALFIGLLMIRKIKPISVPSPTPGGMSLESARTAAQLSEQARQEPEVMQQVLATWLDEPSPGESEADEDEVYAPAA